MAQMVIAFLVTQVLAWEGAEGVSVKRLEGLQVHGRQVHWRPGMTASASSDDFTSQVANAFATDVLELVQASPQTLVCVLDFLLHVKPL